MKKSKHSSKRKNRSRSPHEEKPKRSKHAAKSEEKLWNPEPPKVGPKKTRWEAQKTITDDKTTKTPAKPTQPIPEEKQEKAGPTLRIKDLLHDKEKMIDLLFQTVSGAALQELIPDYLKNRPAEELKKLCLEQLNLMKNEDILQVISGKELEVKVVKTGEANQIISKSELHKQVIPKSEDSNKHIVPKSEDPKEKVEESKIPENSPKNQELHSSVEAENSSSDAIELHATTKEIESIDDDVAKVAMLIKDEVSKTLNLPDRDAELLELEMRARAIRSLLKAKSQAPIDSSAKEDEA